MRSAIESARHAASGPSSTARTVPPTACPVVPPGSGTLNIIAKKENAAATPSAEKRSFGNSRVTFFTEWIQTGATAAARTAQVDALR